MLVICLLNHIVLRGRGFCTSSIAQITGNVPRLLADIVDLYICMKLPPNTSAFACIEFLTLKCEIDRKITLALFRLTLIRYVFKTIYLNIVYNTLHMSLYTPSTLVSLFNGIFINFIEPER